MIRLAAFALLVATAAYGDASLAASSSRPSAGFAAASPPHPAAARLADALERYRAIEARGGWSELAAGPILEIGSSGQRVVDLRLRLAAEGDLPPSAADGTFDRALAEAVRLFQRRHGLDPDARVGPRTLAALNVPVEERIRQIAANVERWREMPDELPARRLEVNIPAAELAVLEDDVPIMSMRVVVGSTRFPTPVLQSRITSVVFNPPWNVPARIARNEILPRLTRQPGYLRDNDIRIVNRAGDPYGETIDWRNRGSVGTLQLQQQPSPKNALGRIKFNFVNGFSVYLHDTPGKEAFDRADRALSHGCVRVQRPEDLARYALRDRLAAEPDLIERALSDWRTREVPLGDPLPIFIVYWTAFVAPDGSVHFRNDIYGHDSRMDLPVGLAASGESEAAGASRCGAAG